MKLKMAAKLFQFCYSSVAVIFFTCSYSKDVRLPQQLQRAMAAEAEAAREARAKVGCNNNTIFLASLCLVNTSF